MILVFAFACQTLVGGTHICIYICRIFMRFVGLAARLPF